MAVLVPVLRCQGAWCTPGGCIRGVIFLVLVPVLGLAVTTGTLGFTGWAQCALGRVVSCGCHGAAGVLRFGPFGAVVGSWLAVLLHVAGGEFGALGTLASVAVWVMVGCELRGPDFGARFGVVPGGRCGPAAWCRVCLPWWGGIGLIRAHVRGDWAQCWGRSLGILAAWVQCAVFGALVVGAPQASW